MPGTTAPNASYNSDPYKKELQETARKPGKVARNIGDVDAVFAKGGKIVEADYYVPHLAHAPMEPPVALADFRDGKVTIWASTQSPQAVQETVAAVLGIPKENVICHVTLLGGGFGRKSKPDYAAEAAILSKAMGKPVKVVWSREDDIKFGYYHAVAAMYMKAALDEKGKPTAWLQRSVFPPIGSTFALNTTYGDGGELGQGWTDLPFDLPNHRAENGSGGKPRPHRMVPLGGKYLSCLRGAVLCQRTRARLGTGFGGISAGTDRSGTNRRRQGFRA